jgi:hypothetical protein
VSPGSEIVLGGHGAAIEGVESLIDCDHVVKGEGIRWMRRHLGQDPEAPIHHPALQSTERASILGVPLLDTPASLLVPGVGCVNGCSFCSTSHFFNRSYVPFLATGEELFDTACRVADERGTDAFFIMDENFLKDRDRALGLLEAMERHRRLFRFHIFSSAEAITAFGIDNLVRLGVDLVWIGFESQSRQEAFSKNAGIDPKKLVRDLRDRGIAVIASGILCMEHHTPENMQTDVDFLVGLESDFVQFMLLTPVPVTTLYSDHKQRGLLRSDLPLQECHGQTKLAYHHPAFTGDEPAQWIRRAFRQDYEVNSSSMLRMVETSIRGYEHLSSLPGLDECLQARLRQYERQARIWRLILPAIRRNAVNELERRRVDELEDRARRLFGLRAWERLAGLATVGLSLLWKLRVQLRGDGIQPRTIVTRYRRSEKAAETPRSTQAPASGELDTRRLPAAAAAASRTA